MYLKSLTLKGFKSFASSTTLAFEPGITAIVGPNGSGKSNVVDALAWVMGEQGAKTLRGAKMDDVIFAGTTSRPPLGRAEVSLTIDNSDGALPIDYTEVTISRTLFRNGGSEYAINGTSCRLLDVQDLLSDSGMGRQMHVIVGQGQLDQILHATPEQRRGFIEEAAGVLKHRRRKERALRKLESTQANMDRLSDILTELRRQLKPLGRQAEVAKRAVKIQADLRDSTARLLADDLLKARLALQSDRAKGERNAQLREQYEKNLSDLRHALGADEDELAILTPRIEAHQQMFYEAAALRERLLATQSICQERMNHLKSSSPITSSRSPEELDQEAARFEAKEEEYASLIEQATERLQQATYRRQQAEEEEYSAHHRYQIQMKAAADRREGLAKIEGKIATISARLTASSDEVERYRKRLDELSAISIDDGEYEALAADEKNLGESIARYDEQIVDMESRRENLRAREQEIRSSIASHQAEIARCEAYRAAIEVDKVAIDAHELIAQQGSSRLLGEAIQIDPSWEKAVVALLDHHSDSVLIETDHLDRLVDLLTEKQADRVELLCADRRNAAHISRDLPDGAIWALEAITYEDRYGAVIESLLDGAILARDCATARACRTLYPDSQIATCQGHRYMPYGVVVGHYRQRPRLEIEALLTASLKEEKRYNDLLCASRDELQICEDDEKRCREQLDKIRAQRHHLDSKRRELLKKIASYEQRVRSVDEEKQRLITMLGAAQSRIENDQSRYDEYEQRRQIASCEQIELPDPEQKDRASVQARQARSEELEARLALRAAEERQRSIAGKADFYRRAARQERHALAQAQLKAVKAQRQAERARAIEQACRWMDEQVEKIAHHIQCDKEKLTGQREQIERRIRERRDEVNRVQQSLNELTSTAHADQLAIVELSLKAEQIEAQAMSEVGMGGDELIEGYGPDQMIPLCVEGVDEIVTVAFNRGEQEKRQRKARRDLKALGQVNPLALEEFDALNERHQFLVEQLDDVSKTKKDLLAMIEQIDHRVHEVFTAAYRDVEQTFSEVFTRLFPGGKGRLVLTDPEDMLTTGIDVLARPAGKKVTRLSLLSGGERSLVAVAFLISLFIARPSPFYILDEVEAALDDVNLSRLLSIYEELRRSSQLLVITHHKKTMEVADALYGVTMASDGISTVISQRLVSS